MESDSSSSNEETRLQFSNLEEEATSNSSPDDDTTTSTTVLAADRVEEDVENKHCWVCFLTSDDDENGINNGAVDELSTPNYDDHQADDSDDQANSVQEWVKPCKCKGSSKWVHQNCLQRWIDEKQRTNSSAKVACAACGSEYVMIFPTSGPVVVVLELFDKFLYAASPFAAATALFGSIYCSACVYGAVTVCQVLGQDEGKAVMESADPLMLIVGLPSIPVMLILSKLFKWEESILKLWKRHYHRIPLLGHVVGTPPECPRESAEKILLGRDSFAEPLAATRMFSGALMLPTAAFVVGKYLFSRIHSNLQRTVLGGLTFVIAKGFMRIYLRQQLYIKHTQRKVCDYSDALSGARDFKDKHALLDALDAGAVDLDHHRDDDPIGQVNHVAARDE